MPAPTAPGQVPLDRALSKLGAASRTEARAHIAAGRVTVGGLVVRDPSTPVTPETADIALDGLPVARAPRRVIVLNKPRGCVTTRRDPRGCPTVFDVLGTAGDGVQAVGRLDQATSGLLLLTNDTRLADWLTDPTSGVPRLYVATVRGLVTDAVARGLIEGLVDRGERLAATEATVLKRSRRESRLRLTLTEGRNREVRRLCAAIGHEVTRLVRVAYGGVALGDLAPGAWREVTPAELAAAFPGAPGRLVRTAGAR